MNRPTFPGLLLGAALALTTPLASLPLVRAASPPAPAQSVPSLDDLFKQALFDEEGRRNYEAAARGYESVVRALDEQQRLAATAVFRLGECYRKLQRTNDAIAQFQRVLRDFSHDETLVTTSRRHLTALGAPPKAPLASPETNAVSGLPGSTTLNSWVEARTKLVTEYNQLSTQLHQVSSILAGSLEKQAFALLALHPDTGLQAMLEHLAKVQTQFDRLNADPKLTLTEYHHAMSAGVATGRAELLDTGLESSHRDRAWAQQQLEKQHQYIRERMNFVLEIERGRLAIMKGTLEQFDRAAKAGQLLDPNSLVAAVQATGPGRDGASMTSEESEEILRIQTLVRNSPDLINATQREGGRAPLHDAAARGQLAVATFLLDHGARVNVSAEQDPGASPLHLASVAGHKAMVELLLQRGADIERTDRRGQTALHAASAKGFVSIVELLLARGATINALGKQGTGTPLALAAAFDRLDVARLLLSKGADPNLAAQKDPAPLARAISLEMLVELLRHQADPDPDSGVTFLRWVNSARLPFVRALLEAVAQRGADRRTPTWNDTLALALTRAVKPDPEAPTLFQLLLDHGADIRRIPEGTEGVLVLAVQTGMDWVRRALDAGANPNQASGSGRVPFQFLKLTEMQFTKATEPDRGRQLDSDSAARWAALQLLVQRGADPNRPGSDGYSLTHLLATWAGSAELEFLRQHGADFAASGPQGETPLMIAVCNLNLDGTAWLLQHGVEVDATDRQGNTALILSGVRPNTEIIRLLLNAKADPARVNAQGNTLRHALNTPQHVFPLGNPVRVPRFSDQLRQPRFALPYTEPKSTPAREALLLIAEAEAARPGNRSDATPASPVVGVAPVAVGVGVADPRASEEPNVTVFGSLFRVIPLRPGLRLTIAGVLRESGVLTNAEPELARTRVLLHRLPSNVPPQGPRQTIPIDLAKLRNGQEPTEDIELQSGDSLEVRRPSP